MGLLSGILIFFLTLVICTFCLFLHANVVFCISGLAMSAFAGLVFAVLVLGRAAWHLPLGCSGMSAIFWGVTLGRYCYSSYGFFALMYANSRFITTLTLHKKQVLWVMR